MNSRASHATVLDRRWTHLCRQQQLARKKAYKQGSGRIDALKSIIPDKAAEKLEWAFCKAFGAVFEYGDGIIDKTYLKEKESRRFMERDLAFIQEGSSPALRAMSESGARSDGLNMLLTTLEGVGLGALGIGVPDIVLFVAMLLRGMREAAAQYGRSVDSNSEKLLGLCMMEAAMLSGADWEERDGLVERMLIAPENYPPKPELIDEQLRRTAAVFATDLLVLKFIQGMPVVGLIGGFGNPVYYHKVMSYVRLKYERAYIREAMQRHAQEE